MDNDTLQMSVKEAIKYIAENHDISSMYGLAKALTNDEVKVQPIQVSKYLKGTKPSKKVADRFLQEFDIIITDVHQPGLLTEAEMNRINND